MSWQESLTSEARASIGAGAVTGTVVGLALIGLTALYQHPSLVAGIVSGLVTGVTHARRKIRESVVCPKCKESLRKFVSLSGRFDPTIRNCRHCGFSLLG